MGKKNLWVYSSLLLLLFASCATPVLDQPPEQDTSKTHESKMEMMGMANPIEKSTFSFNR